MEVFKECGLQPGGWNCTEGQEDSLSRLQRSKLTVISRYKREGCVPAGRALFSRSPVPTRPIAQLFCSNPDTLITPLPYLLLLTPILLVQIAHLNYC